MIPTISVESDANWLELTLQSLEFQGFALLNDVLSPSLVAETRKIMPQVRKRIVDDIGADTLERSARAGYPDLPMILQYHDHFLEFLRLPQILSLVETVLSPAATIRLMNGFILEPRTDQNARELFDQNKFHMNYKQVFNGFRATLEFAFGIEAPKNSGVHMGLVPATQQRVEKPSQNYLEWAERDVFIPQGAALVMDSSLWHREKPNHSGHRWMVVGAQFSQPFIKPHTDIARAIGAERMMHLPERTRRLLGWEARVPASLQEFYQPAENRLYKAPWMIGIKPSRFDKGDA